MLSESRILELVDGALILETFSSLMRSLSPTTSCLTDLGVPIDLKLPEAAKLLCGGPQVSLLLCESQFRDCVCRGIFFPRLKLLILEGNTRMRFTVVTNPVWASQSQGEAAKFLLCDRYAFSLPHAQQPPLDPAPLVAAESVVPPVQP